MTAPGLVTVESLRGLPFELVLHARLGRGGYLFVRRCKAYPRLTIHWKRESPREPEWRTAYVDDVECATIEIVVERLNNPPAAAEPQPAPQLELDL